MHMHRCVCGQCPFNWHWPNGWRPNKSDSNSTFAPHFASNFSFSFNFAYDALPRSVWFGIFGFLCWTLSASVVLIIYGAGRKGWICSGDRDKVSILWPFTNTQTRTRRQTRDCSISSELILFFSAIFSLDSCGLSLIWKKFWISLNLISKHLKWDKFVQSRTDK